jgi:hypothetical protein
VNAHNKGRNARPRWCVEDILTDDRLRTGGCVPTSAAGPLMCLQRWAVYDRSFDAREVGRFPTETEQLREGWHCRGCSTPEGGAFSHSPFSRGLWRERGGHDKSRLLRPLTEQRPAVYDRSFVARCGGLLRRAGTLRSETATRAGWF